MEQTLFFKDKQPQELNWKYQSWKKNNAKKH